MTGWPRLAGHRWTDDEQRRYYAEGLWATEDLWRLLVRNAERRPRAEAFHDGTQGLTFADLLAWSGRVATGLLERGIGVGDVVAVQLPNWVEYAVVRLAVSGVGAALLSLPPDVEPAIAENQVRLTGAKAYVARSAAPPSVLAALAAPAVLLAARTSLPGAVTLDNFGPVGGTDAAVTGGHADAIDLLMGTSGTTGLPKTVMRTANSFLAMGRSVINRTGLDADDTLMIAAPVGQGIGYMHAIVDSALAGCRVILPGRFDSGTLLSMLEEHRVSTFVAVPTVAIRLLADPRLDSTDLSALRSYQSGGAALPPETAREMERRADCRVLIMFGSLDVGIATMTSPLTDADETRHSTVGRAVECVDVRVIDAGGVPLPPGEPGEVVMRGPNTAIGYYADDEGTRRTFDANGWGHFGDLGLLDHDGRLRIVGRLKDVIIRGGRNISAAEVEGVARRHPNVVDAAAVATPDPELGERCVLFVVARTGHVELTDVVAYFEEQGVAKYKWPERVVTLDELPLDPQSKVRKAVLREWLRAEAGSS